MFGRRYQSRKNHDAGDARPAFGSLMNRGGFMSTSGTASIGADKTEIKHGSFIGRSFERLGMLPVLIVMCALFYALTLYYSDDGTSNFLTASNTMNVLRQVAINLVLACR